MSLVAKSATTIAAAVPQNNRRSAALSIFLPGLALDAQAGVGKRVEAIEPDGIAALLAAAEPLGRAVQAGPRLLHIPEIAPFLPPRQALPPRPHSVRSLVWHHE